MEAVEITDIAAEGKSLAKVGEKVVFVPYGAPGDIVDIQVTKSKSSFAEGKIVRFHKKSEKRTEPFCTHFGICGGCKWQHVNYEEQLLAKQKQVVDALVRIGHLKLPALVDMQTAENQMDAENYWDSEGLYPIFGSQKIREYRNKLEYTFSNKRWLTQEEIQSEQVFEFPDALGFHIPGMFDKVLDIEACHLQDNLSNELRLFVRDFCRVHQFPFFNLRTQEGFMRNLMIRNTSTGEWMVLVMFYRDEPENIKLLLDAISDKFPNITSLMYVINQKANDTIGDQDIFVYKGQDCIVEVMEDLKFKIGPKSFYQTNSAQAYQLYRVVRAFAGLKPHELVYDLYTGTGTIAQFVAKQAKQVIGIEYVPEAIQDAQVNAKNNQIENVMFFAGDMKDILTDSFLDIHGKPDVIITDPPRAGMHADVVKTILNAAPGRIVYVSCNPATQARDLALLNDAYEITKIQPVDLFPHTHHVENVVLLVKREA